MSSAIKGEGQTHFFKLTQKTEKQKEFEKMSEDEVAQKVHEVWKADRSVLSPGEFFLLGSYRYGQMSTTPMDERDFALHEWENQIVELTESIKRNQAAIEADKAKPAPEEIHIVEVKD